MLSFAVYSNGKPANEISLSGAYVVGNDDVPLRAEITFSDGVINCSKRAAGPAGLALLWDVAGVGTILTETVRLQEREKPYILQVELARGRLVRINQKLEDWGLFDYEGTEKITGQISEARELLIKALKADSRTEAAALGEQSLSKAVQASESLSRFHAEVFFSRRKQTGVFPRRVFGCAVSPDRPTEISRKRLSAAFDFVTVTLRWRDIEPNEQTFNWKAIDAWIDLLTKHRIPMRGSPLLSFSEENVPEWLYVWKHDFDTVRDMAFEHIRRVINRYGQYIQAWNVVSGIHANNCFTFSFEQLMELTRMAAAIAKQSSPSSLTIIDLVAPWGEYYARSQRTIPPMLYADMVVQSGVDFDAFGIQVYFGPGVDGTFVRDMFQISSLLDLFAKVGKPLHISAVQVPSDVVPVRSTRGDSEEIALDGGRWHEPWSEEIQAEWLQQFLDLALSKPFVESVTWRCLTDDEEHSVPHGGLLRADLAPKAAYHQLVKTRSEIMGPPRKGDRSPAT